MKKQTVRSLFSCWLHAGALAVFILNTLIPAPALAASRMQEDGTPTPDSSGTPLVPEASATPTTTGTPTESSSPTATPTGTPTPLPKVGPTQTPTPTPTNLTLVTPATELPSSGEQFQVDGKGGKISAMEGRVKVSFPKGIFAEQVSVSVDAPVRRGVDMPPYMLTSHPFQIKARGLASKKELRQFNAQIAIDVDYSTLVLDDTDEHNLMLYYYDTSLQEWVALPSHADPASRTLRAYTTHFTVFDVGVNNFQASHLPTVDAFQVSQFTGAGTYGLPIEVPAGPGGLQPNLTLNYNSQVIDQSTTQTQASWVGMGWSLETGSIERNTHGTFDGTAATTADDSWILNVAGISSTIVKNGNNFVAADENFVKITFANDIWTVWDKVGNVYTFGYQTQMGYDFNCTNTMHYATMKWSLTKVRNIFGKELSYNYTDDTKPMSAWYPVGDGNCAPSDYYFNVTTATYPTTIVYPNSRYRIRFETEGRTDFPAGWLSDNAYHSFQRKRLKFIHVEQDADNNGTFETIVRRYQFDYAANNSSNLVWPGVGNASRKTSTLTQVQQYGVGGAASLPATTFLYGDDMHLTDANNGYGGTVHFDYDLWYYGANGRASQRNKQAFGTAGTPCNTGNFSLRSYDHPGDNVWCVDNSGQPDALHVRGTAINTSLLNNWLFTADALRPGGVYRFFPTGLAFGPHITVQYGLADGQGDNWGATFVTLPATASKADVLVKTINSGGPASEDASFSSLTVKLLPSFSRVTAKTLNDGQGHQYTFSYGYSGGAINNGPCTDAQLDATPPTCAQYYEKYSEFRGFNQVTESGPNGRTVVTTFNQVEPLQGRPSDVTIKQGSTVLSKTVYAYNVTNLLMTSPISDYLGISRNWVTTAREQTCIYDNAGANIGGTRSDYTYKPISEYGNLARTDEAEISGRGPTCSFAAGQPVAYRSTVIDYSPVNNGSVYLTGLPTVQSVLDGGGALKAQTLNIYDSAPVTGKLNAVRTLVDGASYSQINYSYDTWGNRTGVTAYNSYGTASTDPGSGARMIATAFDTDGYSTYPISQTLPQVGSFSSGFITRWTYDYTLGLPTSQSLPYVQGETPAYTTTVGYDTFGRLTKLVRSGDSNSNPSLSVSYNGANPLRIDVKQRVDSATDSYYVLRRFYDGLGRQFQTDTGSSSGVNGSFALYNTTRTGYDAYGHATSQGTPYATGETPAYGSSAYDALGRPLLVTAPDGSQTTYTYNGLLASVSANGQTTGTELDSWGRTKSVTPPSGPAVSYTYNEFNRLVTALRGGATTTIHYDAAGRKTDMIDPDMGTWSYSYDALGQLTSQTDARGCVLALTYDNLGRLQAKSSSGSGCGAQVSSTYSYDAGTFGKGWRTGMDDASIANAWSADWTYDERGRVTKESKTIGTQIFDTYQTYNTADLPVTTKYPDLEDVTSTYTSQTLLDTVSGTNTYVADTTYDSAGRVTSRALGNSLTQAFNYFTWDGKDPAVPGDISHSGSGGKLRSMTTGTIQSLAYTYNPSGNIKDINDAISGETQAFTYDPLDRLFTASATNGPANYSDIYIYDSITGNLSSKANISLEYNDSAHKHAATDMGANHYTYDANGNQIKREIGSTTYTIDYDAEGHVVTVNGPSMNAQFTYDGDGAMVQAVENGIKTLYPGPHYEVTNPGAGQTVSKYYSAGGARVAMRKYVIPQRMSIEYMLGDHLGSTSMTTDANGAKISEMRYKPWGETRYTWSDPSLSSTPVYKLPDYTYTGQRSYTADFGLMFYNARWYDPALGRFAQADTMVPDGIQGYDRYAYTGNNPINYADPSGHWSCAGMGGGSNHTFCEADNPDNGPTILDRSKMKGWDTKDTERANSLYSMYLDMYKQTDQWWWGTGNFTIWDFMAIFWNYERARLGNNKMMIDSQINRAPDYCPNQCASAEDNLVYLAAYAQAAQTRADNYDTSGDNDISGILGDPPFGSIQPGINIVNGIRTSAVRRKSGGLGAFAAYDYGNVSLNVDLYTRMIKFGWTIFNTDLSEGPNTFFILGYCQSQAAADAIAHHHGRLSIRLYNSWCSPPRSR